MLQDVLEIIRSRDSFAITSHVRPDGDALGSELALMFALEALGKKAEVINRDPVPDRYRCLPGSDRILNRDILDGSYGGVFVLECGSIARTGLDGLDKQFIINI